MKYLIFNADDFGLTEGVNNGIVDAFKNGVVRSTTTLANSMALEHALVLSKENPGLGIGIHLALTIGKPLTSGLKTIVDPNGNFYKLSVIEEKMASFDETELETEFTAQFEKLIKLGFEITHIDSHHHVHMLPKVKPVAEKIAKKYNVGMRKISGLDSNILTTSAFSDKFYADGVSVEGLKAIISENKEVESLEIMCHPAVVDETLIGMTGYSKKRSDELNIIKSDEIKKFIDDEGIKLVNFAELN